MTEEIINSDGNRNWQANILLDNVKRLEQERDDIQDRLFTLADTYQEARNVCKRLEQENEKLKKEVKQIGSDFIKKGDYARALEQENKSLYEEKNCLHKIIDRLLENAGYSKDIASAEDFEDVYEDMQRKINELAELEQENKQMKSALEEIKENLVKLKTNDEDDFTYEYSKIEDKINEALK